MLRRRNRFSGAYCHSFSFTECNGVAGSERHSVPGTECDSKTVAECNDNAGAIGHRFTCSVIDA